MADNEVTIHELLSACQDTKKLKTMIKGEFDGMKTNQCAIVGIYLMQKNNFPVIQNSQLGFFLFKIEKLKTQQFEFGSKYWGNDIVRVMVSNEQYKYELSKKVIKLFDNTLAERIPQSFHNAIAALKMAQNREY